MGGGIERRRLARIPLRCAVVVREKLATTVARTEDVGPRGCRILLQRPAAPGALLQIRFTPGADAESLEAVGQVVWARKAAPLLAGVRFVSAPRVAVHDPGGNWLEGLVAAELRRVVGGELELGALGDVQLEVQVPPRPVAQHEVAAVRVARAGGTVSMVAAAADGLAAVAGLLERGVVGIARAHVAAAGASGPALDGRPARAANGTGAAIVPPPPPALVRTA